MSDPVEDARHLSPWAQEVLRLRAVAASVAGRDPEDVEAVFGASRKGVGIWWATWQADGREALVMQARDKPVEVHQVLGEAEQAAVRQAVLDHRPCDVGLTGQLWTRRLVGELIAKLYRVRLTEPGVGTYLKQRGLSLQHPDKRTAEQDSEAVRHWLRETWPKIRAKANMYGGEILLAGQVGIRSDQVAGRPWGEKGRTPAVRRSGNRFSVNAMSAISTKGRMHFVVLAEGFTAAAMCRFLEWLAGHFNRKAHLAVDGHSAHCSRKVRDWLADHPYNSAPPGEPASRAAVRQRHLGQIAHPARHLAPAVPPRHRPATRPPLPHAHVIRPGATSSGTRRSSQPQTCDHSPGPYALTRLLVHPPSERPSHPGQPAISMLVTTRLRPAQE
ncbi:IS630 family transposase [Streptomyces sp. Qhu_M48]|uniref:IS630 family transposase n=1 Tax=Streptomyces sp. Qhu_M48 TaxID=3435889 RepID=UPI003F4F7BDC